jgi:hypothetical protein
MCEKATNRKRKLYPANPQARFSANRRAAIMFTPRAAERVDFAEHFGCPGPPSLSNGKSNSKVAANNARACEA